MLYDTHTCYICFAEETKENPFLKEQICACKDLNIHQLCYEKCRNGKDNLKCKMCRQDITVDFAFDSTWNYEEDPALHEVSFQKLNFYLENHGPYVVIRYINNVRYIDTIKHYKNGMLHGEFKIYHPNGTVLQEEEYFEGQKHGKFFRRLPYGTVISEENWNMGVEDGDFKYYRQNQIIGGKYKDGKKIGEHLEPIDVSYRFFQKGCYSDGIKNGTFKLFKLEKGIDNSFLETVYENGSVKSFAIIN